MNFFQKGLAGLESRLDKVLLDETDQAALAARHKEKLLPAPAAALEPALRRSGETTRGRTSMQERLKAAVEGGRGSGSGSRSRTPAGRDSTDTTSGSRSRTPAGRNSTDTTGGKGSVDVSRGSNRGSLDVERGADGGSPEEEEPEEPEEVEAEAVEEEKTIPIVIEPEDLGKEEVTNGGGDSEVPSPVIERPPSPLAAAPTNGDTSDHLPTNAKDLRELLIRLQADLAICETRRAEEFHAASERVDALEAKLQYLSRSSAAEARERSASTPTEKALAERDEKIALLMEEGEQLSKNELKLQTAIKKLRAKAQDDEKAAAEAKRRQEKAEKQVEDEKEKTRKLQESERKLNEKVKALGNMEGEIETLRKGNVAATKTVKDLEQRLDEERMKVDEAERRVQTEALEKEKKATLELGARLERVQSEAAMVEEKLKSEVGDLKSKVERGSEKARARETELKAEQSVMESKMEALRARVEEASSGSSGDAHAKLLRQLETLQTQYAIASENWQGIEGSLLGRVSNLERERDDLAKKESDIRRRAREMSSKSKTLESDLETAHSKIRDLESEITSLNEALAALRARLATAESVRSSFTKERESWERELQTRIEEERTKWEETAHLHIPPPTSPSPPPQPLPVFRKPPAAISITESIPVNQRYTPISASVEPSIRSPGFRTPPAHGALPNNSLSSLPASHDDYFDYSQTPSAPFRNPDLMSVSTVAAGPSVQLVERMSATVRRLESEMAASREEIARMTALRDEARREMVELMTEAEQKRASEERARELERELEANKLKLETALEMLGETSEAAEELRADVQDLKAMYRELVLEKAGGGDA